MSSSLPWIHDCMRTFMVGHHIPDYDQTKMATDILIKVNPKEFVRELKKAHVQAFWFYSKCHYGNAYYPSKVGHVHSALKGRDLFGEYTEACLSAGIMPLGLYEFADHRIIKNKPEWCHRIPPNPEKGIVDITDAVQGASVGGPCLNGPYGDFAIEQALEVVKNYPIKAYLVDFLGLFGFEAWICPYCNEKFRHAFGFDFPGIARLPHEQYVKYIRWRYEQYDAYTKRLLDAIRSVAPDIVFTHNFHALSDGAGMQNALLSSKNCTYLHADLFSLREGMLPISWKTRILSGGSAQARGETLLDSMTCTGGGDFLTPKPLDSYREELWTARSVGLATCCSIMMDVDGSLDRRIFALTEKVFGEQKKYEEWLTGMEPVATVGILRSQQSMEFRPREDDAPRPFHAMDFEGWVQMAIESHQLWDVVQDHQMTPDYLRRFKVLVLPDAACLSDAQAAAVRAFVEEGGELIATGESSLFDENGIQRKDFALADVFGANYVEERKNARKYIVLKDKNLRPREKWVTDTLVFAEGQWEIKSKTAAKVLGVIGNKPDFGLANRVIETEKPALIENRSGKGRAYYLGCLLGAQYKRYGHHTVFRLARNLFARTVGRGAMVHLEGPGTIEVFAHFQREKSRLIVGLVQNVGVSRSEGAAAQREFMHFDMIEEMPRVSTATLTVRLNKGQKIKRVLLAPDGKKIPFKSSGAGTAEIKLEDLGVYTMIVIEY